MRLGSAGCAALAAAAPGRERQRVVGRAHGACASSTSTTSACTSSSRGLR